MLKELKIHHREIGRLRFEGLKPADIAKRLEMNYQSVSGILRDPLCKAYINGLADKADAGIIDVRKELAEMNIMSLNVLKDCLDPNNLKIPASVRLAAAKDNLDRSGFKPVEKSTNISFHITSDDIKELKERQLQLIDTNDLDQTQTLQ